MSVVELISTLVASVEGTPGAGTSAIVSLVQKGAVTVTQASATAVSETALLAALQSTLCSGSTTTCSVALASGGRRLLAQHRQLQTSQSFDYVLPLDSGDSLDAPSIDSATLAAAAGTSASDIQASAAVTETVAEVTSYGGDTSSALDVPAAAASALGLSSSAVSIVAQPVSLKSPSPPPPSPPPPLPELKASPSPPKDGSPSPPDKEEEKEVTSALETLEGDDSTIFIVIGASIGGVVLFCFMITIAYCLLCPSRLPGPCARRLDARAKPGGERAPAAADDAPDLDGDSASRIDISFEDNILGLPGSPRDRPQPQQMQLPEPVLPTMWSPEIPAVAHLDARVSASDSQERMEAAAAPLTPSAPETPSQLPFDGTPASQHPSTETRKALVGEPAFVQDAARALFNTSQPQEPRPRAATPSAAPAPAPAASPFRTYSASATVNAPATGEDEDGAPAEAVLPAKPALAASPLYAGTNYSPMPTAREHNDSLAHPMPSEYAPPSPEALPVEYFPAAAPPSPTRKPSLTRAPAPEPLAASQMYPPIWPPTSPALSVTTAAERAAQEALEFGIPAGVAEVLVPAGCGPGQVFRATIADGRELTICCPDDAFPGDLLEIDVPALPPKPKEPTDSPERDAPVETVEVAIPESNHPGDTFTVLASWGGAFDVVVPPGTTPGSSLFVELPVAPPPGTEPDAGTPLSPGGRAKVQLRI